MRLIDADALADALFERHKNYPQWVAETIENMPDTIVKCRYCKFFIGEGHYCKIRGMGRVLKPDDFCSDGRSVK